MTISISRIQNDIPKLRQLNALFSDVFDDQTSYSSTPPSDSYLSAWLENNDNIALVALVDSVVVGGIVSYTLHKFEQQRSEVYIYDLAVSRDYQRQGIGKRLIEQLCNVAKEQGASTVFVQADEGDDAIHFYESLNPIENLKTRTFDLPL